MAKAQQQRSKRLGLRARTAIALAGVGLLVSVVLGLLTYQLAKSYLLDQRVNFARSTAFLHAADLDASLADSPETVDEVVSNRSAADATVLIRIDDTWKGAVVGVGERDIDADVRDAVAGGTAAQKVQGGGDPTVVVGIPLPSSGAEYYELFELNTLEDTLGVLRNVLIAAGAIATVAGAIFGLFVSRRVLAPLRVSAHAAEKIAAGDLGTRLDEDGDPDFSPLSEAFNEMATSLELRIIRERRFAADVSHELRTPLASLASAVSLLSRRTDELSETGQEAFEVIRDQIRHFNDLVLEILDLSRMEAGIANVQVEAIGVRRFIESVLEEHHLSSSMLEIADSTPQTLLSDPRRLRVVFRNIIENASHYAGGITSVEVKTVGDKVVFAFNDSGPGLARSEQTEVFERFRRGSAAPAPDAPRGTGLGLSMATENMRLLGGRISAEDSPAGGARFVVEVKSSSLDANLAAHVATGEPAGGV